MYIDIQPRGYTPTHLLFLGKEVKFKQVRIEKEDLSFVKCSNIFKNVLIVASMIINKCIIVHVFNLDCKIFKTLERNNITKC